MSHICPNPSKGRTREFYGSASKRLEVELLSQTHGSLAKAEPLRPLTRRKSWQRCPHCRQHLTEVQVTTNVKITMKCLCQLLREDGAL